MKILCMWYGDHSMNEDTMYVVWRSQYEDTQYLIQQWDKLLVQELAFLFQKCFKPGLTALLPVCLLVKSQLSTA